MSDRAKPPDTITQRAMSWRLAPEHTVCRCCGSRTRAVYRGAARHPSTGRTLCLPCITDPANAYADCRHGLEAR